MRLMVSVPEVFIAQEDIPCYKIYINKYRAYINKKEEYISPYRKAPIPEFNVLNTTKLGDAILSDRSEYSFEVNEGFHSYVNLFDAYPRYFIYNSIIDNAIVVKCIIPKGSKFYEGIFDKHKSYCSESIILKEIIYTVKRNINLEEK